MVELRTKAKQFLICGYHGGTSHADCGNHYTEADLGQVAGAGIPGRHTELKEVTSSSVLLKHRILDNIQANQLQKCIKTTKKIWTWARGC